MALATALTAIGCTGPQTHVHHAPGDRCFIDGMKLTQPSLPFRYYGTSRWDAQPADLSDGFADWSRQPSSAPIELPAPASLWLFPLDLPLELARRAVHGREDVAVAVALPPTPPEMVVQPEFRPSGLERVTERALQARIAR